MEYVRGSDPRVHKPFFSGRQRVLLLLAGMIILLTTILVTWPSTVEDPSGDLVFEGEVWGDLSTEGDIWGENVPEHDWVYIRHSGRDGGLLINVTNVSNLWLFDLHTDTNISVPCNNNSFIVVADNGNFNAYLSNLEFECEYLEFIGIYPGDTDTYSPDFTVISVEGHGNLVHGEYHGWDIQLDDCRVVVDGVEYHDIDSIFIPEDETPYVEVWGSVGTHGNIHTSFPPHVNGTLVVVNFLHIKDGRTQMYDRIKFEGEDIFIDHNGRSQYGTGGPFPFYDPWTIEVTISPDTTVEIWEADDTPLWVEAILIGLLLIIVLYTIRFLRGRRSKD
jgi:hypothetical protein